MGSPRDCRPNRPISIAYDRGTSHTIPTMRGGKLLMLTVPDEHTRLSRFGHVDRNINAARCVRS